MSLSQLQTSFLNTFNYLNAQNKRNNSRVGFYLNNNKKLTAFLEQQARHLNYSVSTATNDHDVIDAIIAAVSKAYCERTALQYRTREIVTKGSNSYYVETCMQQGEFERQLLVALTACTKTPGIDVDVQTKIRLLKNRLENLPTQMRVELKTRKNSTGNFASTEYTSKNFQHYLHTGITPHVFANVAASEHAAFWSPKRRSLAVSTDTDPSPAFDAKTRPRARCCY